jgi:hypothetical protein
MSYWWHSSASSVAVSGANAVATPATVAATAATPATTDRATAIAPLEAPTALLIFNLTQTELTLSWAESPGATKYDIERNGVIVFTDWPLTAVFDNGLTPGTSYRYRVMAKP